MRFRINLKPYPGAQYFTVSEYVRAFDKLPQNSKEHVNKSEHLLRDLFSVPADFKMTLHDLTQKKEVLDHFKTIFVRDDPETGTVRKSSGSDFDQQESVADISFSFPQPIDLSIYSSIIIDPNASLGIPADFFVLFSKKEIPSASEIHFDDHLKNVFVMTKVLEDLHTKGKELLMREANYKAAVLYQLIENSKYMESIPDKNNRSKTVISAFCDMEFSETIKETGYELSVRKIKEKVFISIANYPTHSKELIEMFSDRILAL